jgi:voltage-gated potassium channel
MPTKYRLEKFINHKYTDIAIAGLIFSSILLVLLEAFWEAHGSIRQYTIGILVNNIITIIFIIELSIRFFVCRKKTRFFKSYWLDLLAVIPMAAPFRALRFLRLLRIFRLGVLVNRRILKSATFRDGIKGYVMAFSIILIVILSGGLLIRVIEGSANPAFDSLIETILWTTMSMISGEPLNFMPKTLLGKSIALLLMLAGITLFAFLTGVISAIMVKKLIGGVNVKDLEMEDLNNHIIICGWNRSAGLIIEEFQSIKDCRSIPIVLIAEFKTDPPLNYNIIDRNMIYIIKGDYTKVEVLKSAGIEKAKVAFIVPDRTIERSDQDRDARTVLAALTIEKLSKKVFTCVELLNRSNESHLKMAGVEEVIVSDEYAGYIMAAAAQNYGIVAILNELLNSKYGNQFYKLNIPSSWVGRTVRNYYLLLKEQYNAILLAVENKKNHPKSTLVNPDNDYTFKDGDKLILISLDKIPLEKLE